ncbi:MAG: DUF3768 domain-containing protein [Caulobacteraceae bacterium]|nr:DUF3768 domain-containing protein [Caulobacteraceae bacterium]
MSEDRRARIRALNDRLRRDHHGGRILVTPGVSAKGFLTLVAALEAVRTFDAFEPDNDPYGEHDFGAFSIGADRLFWKIDYYDQSLTSAAVDPACANGCVRVLTIMLAEEY